MQIVVISTQRVGGQLSANHNLFVQVKGKELLQGKPIHDCISMGFAKPIVAQGVAKDGLIDVLHSSSRYIGTELQSGMVVEVVHGKA